ncbi:hypothetical protein Nepgr_021364 [Nepenthes gracilis]|uniref:Uncharacterized protein n=1 Tax=Nepenthes gracilis TaxID=150966 RepID=A0AAD3SY13_NEPGR|nr:hypothetical protein Nepgr_021364 [Nepenthes gracilis]
MVATGRASARFFPGRRILTCAGDHRCCPNVECSDQDAVSLSDTVFGFLEQSPESMRSSSSGSGSGGGSSSGGGNCSEECWDDDNLEEEDEGGSSVRSIEENKGFWEKQNMLLQEALRKTSSLEKKIRKAAKEALDEAQNEGNFCDCRRQATGTCRNCITREIARRLRNAGYDSAVCRSKWRTSPEMPSGEHTFVDVIEKTSSKKGTIRLVIELSFKAEFEIGRANEEYNQLIGRLPEAFIGKTERLRSLIKILCSAMRKCMTDNKMHIGPWRKHKHMKAKWFGSCERVEPMARAVTQGFDEQPTHMHRASNTKLALVLHDMMPNVHHKAVEVV